MRSLVTFVVMTMVVALLVATTAAGQHIKTMKVGGSTLSLPQ